MLHQCHINLHMASISCLSTKSSSPVCRTAVILCQFFFLNIESSSWLSCSSDIYLPSISLAIFQVVASLELINMPFNSDSIWVQRLIFYQLYFVFSPLFNGDPSECTCWCFVSFPSYLVLLLSGTDSSYPSLTNSLLLLGLVYSIGPVGSSVQP